MELDNIIEHLRSVVRMISEEAEESDAESERIESDARAIRKALDRVVSYARLLVLHPKAPIWLLKAWVRLAQIELSKAQEAFDRILSLHRLLPDLNYLPDWISSEFDKLPQSPELMKVSSDMASLVLRTRKTTHEYQEFKLTVDRVFAETVSEWSTVENFSSILRRYTEFLIRHSAPNLIRRVPGSQLQRLSDFLFSPKTYNLIFEPTLRDLFEEYAAALDKGRVWKARWVRLRGYWAFWSALLAQMPISVSKLAYRIWKAIP